MVTIKRKDRIVGVVAYWPLALLVLVPVIVILYILRQRVRKQRISSIMLWAEAFRSKEATKPWERLRRNLLMVLQILAVLLVILALMRPWLRSGDGSGSQLILVLDNSASMSTLREDGVSRLDAAKQAARVYVDEAAEQTAIHVIRCDSQAVLVLGGGKDRIEAEKRIDSVEETLLPGDLSASLGLVRSVAAQSEENRIVFFTDTAFDLGDLEAAVESVWDETGNLALESISAKWKDEALQVLMLVENDSGEDAGTEINLYGVDGEGMERLLDIGMCEVLAEESATVLLEIPASKLEGVISLRAELNGGDALLGDNNACCTLEEERKSRILLLSGSNLFLEKAIGGLSGMELERSDDPSVADGAYDLIIFDGIVPEKLPENGSFLFVGCGEEHYAPMEGEEENRTLTVTESELGAYIEGTSFGANRVKLYRLPAWGTSLVAAGKGQCAGFYGSVDGRRVAALGFDLHETDLGLRAEFPILMSNLCGYLTETGLVDKSSYTVGEEVLILGSARGSDLELVLPDGSRQNYEAGKLSGTYLETSQAGIFRISQKQQEQVIARQFCVNFPAGRESKVQPAQNIEQSERKEVAQGNGFRELREAILLMLIILLLLEWALYLKQK